MFRARTLPDMAESTNTRWYRERVRKRVFWVSKPLTEMYHVIHFLSVEYVKVFCICSDYNPSTHSYYRIFSIELAPSQI